MLAAAVLTLAASLATPTVAGETPAKPICQNTQLRKVEKSPESVRPKALAEEPNARRVLTVVRTIHGCQVPVLVGGEVGSRPRAR